MKKLIHYALPFVMLSFATSVHAVETPMQFVKRIYANFIYDLSSPSQFLPEIEQLQEKLDRISQQEHWEMCSWSENHTLIPGNDFDTELKHMTFTTLANGKIRAQGRNFGHSFHMDFDVKCTAQEGCKIYDMISSNSPPRSYKQTLKQIIKDRNC